MLDTSTLSSQFQISIPEEVRLKFGWEPGQVFAFIPKGTPVMLVPAPTVGRLAGVASGAKGANHRDRDDRF